MIRWVMIRPPAKKPITAIKEGACRSDKPLMACPEVHPPAQREPKPTMNPPIASMRKPLSVNTDSQLNNSSGCAPVGAANPITDRSRMVDSEINTGSPSDRNCAAMYPPMAAPIRNIRFHVCVFQLKLKNLKMN